MLVVASNEIKLDIRKSPISNIYFSIEPSTA